MMLSLLTAIAYPVQSYQADLKNYQVKEYSWPLTRMPQIIVCKSDKINLQHVKDAKKFWNSQETKIKLQSISYTNNCTVDVPPGYILITNRQKTITRSKEYGKETSFHIGNITLSSYIEINTDLPDHVVKMTIAHELGHALGFKHCLSCKKTDIMQIE